MFMIYGPPPWAAKMGSCPLPATTFSARPADADVQAAPDMDDVNEASNEAKASDLSEHKPAVAPKKAEIGGTVAPSGLRRLEVAFDDIPCPGHIRTILDAMELVKGVGKVKVYYSDNRGIVDYDPSLVSPEEILAGMPPDCPAKVVADNPKG